MVLRALQWFVRHNIYNSNINISEEAFTILPEDGDLTGLCSVIIDSSTSDEEEPPAQDVIQLSPEEVICVYCHSEVDRQETIRQSVHQSTPAQIISLAYC